MSVVSGLPCRHEKDVPSCWFCANWDRSVGYTKVGAPPTVVVSKPTIPKSLEKNAKAIEVEKKICIYFGRKLADSRGCNCGPLHQCSVFENCRKFDAGLDPVAKGVCLGCPSRKTRDQDRPNPKAGVVIGTYGLPSLAALQIKLIRKHNGEVPILLVDDCSDGTDITPLEGTNFGKLSKLSRENKGVLVWSNPVRMGHAGGDMTSFFTGIQWAAANNLDALVKFSFRFVFDRPNWLADWLADFWPSGRATSSQKAREGGARFDIRSECMMMDTRMWNQEAILDHIRPRPLSKTEGKWGVAGEAVLWDTIRDRLDNDLHRCKLFNEDRYQKQPGFLWHCANGADEYKAVFDREGIEMDPGFTNAPWASRPGYQG